MAPVEIVRTNACHFYYDDESFKSCESDSVNFQFAMQEVLESPRCKTSVLTSSDSRYGAQRLLVTTCQGLPTDEYLKAHDPDYSKRQIKQKQLQAEKEISYAASTLHQSVKEIVTSLWAPVTLLRALMGLLR